MLKDKILDIFVQADDFSIEFNEEIKKFRISDTSVKRGNRKAFPKYQV